MRSSILITVLALSLLAHAACGSLPRDPKETLRQLSSRPVRVGLVEHPPWVVRTDGEPAGVEVELIRNFASQLGTTTDWHWGGEQEQLEALEQYQLEALEQYQLDIVIGGFTDQTPWRKYVGLTGPYFEETYRVATPAKRLSWITIAFMLSIIAVVGLTMGSSEAMKAVWIEDILSLIPPIAFLVGTRYFDRAPDDHFPYGYRRAVMIAFLGAAVALVGFGLYILIDSAITLVFVEPPSIQTMEIFGRRVWLGWLMIAALFYSVIPPFILGRMKQPLAQELHQKALQTDANMNKGDWLAGAAGILGITGVAFGYWWADAVAAIIISVEILRDGFSDLKHSVAQLMNKRPSDVEGKPDSTPDKVQHELERLDWVKQARVRLREDGDVLTGEAFIVPNDEADLLNRLHTAYDVANGVDWRLHDVNIVPVRSLD